MNKIGIYLITNNVNGKKYVGQSRNLIKRWNQHKTESSKDGKFIKKWDLISDIAKELGIDHCCIYAVLTGKQKTGGGYIWRCI